MLMDRKRVAGILKRFQQQTHLCSRYEEGRLLQPVVGTGERNSASKKGPGESGRQLHINNCSFIARSCVRGPPYNKNGPFCQPVDSPKSSLSLALSVFLFRCLLAFSDRLPPLYFRLSKRAHFLDLSKFQNFSRKTFPTDREIASVS